MNKKILTFFLWILSSLGFSQTTWVINKDHSELHFSIDYLKFAEVSGRFKKFHGRIQMDSSGNPLALDIQIDAKSIDTGNDIRDGHLKDSGFLGVKSFPYITYQANSFTKNKGDIFVSNGNLKIKNKAYPIRLEFSLSKIINDTWKFQNRFVKFKTNFKRSNFDINWNKTLPKDEFLIGDEIKVQGIIQLQPQGELTPGSRHKIPDTQYIREREKLNRGEISTAPSSSKIDYVTETKSEKSQILKSPEIEAVEENEKSTLWWMALFIMGLIGFLSSIMVSFFIKNYFISKKGEKYSENGWLGLMSDAIAIAILMIYSFCFWIIGWS